MKYAPSVFSLCLICVALGRSRRIGFIELPSSTSGVGQFARWLDRENDWSCIRISLLAVVVACCIEGKIYGLWVRIEWFVAAAFWSCWRRILKGDELKLGLLIRFVRIVMLCCVWMSLIVLRPYNLWQCIVELGIALARPAFCFTILVYLLVSLSEVVFPRIVFCILYATLVSTTELIMYIICLSVILAVLSL